MAIDVAIIGAQKAGSTHLATCLGEHPQIHIVDHEVPYFQNPFFTNSKQASLDKALATDRPVRGLKRPDYLAAPEVPERLQSHSPDVLTLCVLRDPIARVVSAYYWYMQLGLLPLQPLNDGMGHLLDQTSAFNSYPRSHEILDNSMYGTHLRRWTSIFPSEQIQVVAASQLGDASLYNDLFGKLDVPAVEVPSIGNRTNDGVFDSRRIRFLGLRRRFVFDWDDSDVYLARSPRWRTGLRSPIGIGLGMIDRGLLSRVFTREPDALDSVLVMRLSELFEPQLEMVEQDFGLALPLGGQDPTTAKGTRS
jgi:hypothetical protein